MGRRRKFFIIFSVIFVFCLYLPKIFDGFYYLYMPKIVSKDAVLFDIDPETHIGYIAVGGYDTLRELEETIDSSTKEYTALYLKYYLFKSISPNRLTLEYIHCKINPNTGQILILENIQLMGEVLRNSLGLLTILLFIIVFLLTGYTPLKHIYSKSKNLKVLKVKEYRITSIGTMYLSCLDESGKKYVSESYGFGEENQPRNVEDENLVVNAYFKGKRYFIDYKSVRQE